MAHMCLYNRWRHTERVRTLSVLLFFSSSFFNHQSAFFFATALIFFVFYNRIVQNIDFWVHVVSSLFVRILFLLLASRCCVICVLCVCVKFSKKQYFNGVFLCCVWCCCYSRTNRWPCRTVWRPNEPAKTPIPSSTAVKPTLTWPTWVPSPGATFNQVWLKIINNFLFSYLIALFWGLHSLILVFSLSGQVFLFRGVGGGLIIIYCLMETLKSFGYAHLLLLDCLSGYLYTTVYK